MHVSQPALLVAPVMLAGPNVVVPTGHDVLQAPTIRGSVDGDGDGVLGIVPAC